MAIKASQIDAAITLELDEDEITVGEFTSALDHFLGLVREVSKSIDSTASRDWLVKVYEGSAGIGLYSRPGQSSAGLNVVRAAVLDGMNALAEGRRPERYNDKAIEHARNISKVFEKRRRPVTSVRIWSGKERAVPVKKEVAIEAAKLLDPVYEDYGSVEGILEVVSAHEKLECTIYDTIGNRAIKCDLVEDRIEDAVAAFRKRVEVFGRVHYRKDGMAVRVLADKIVKFPAPSEIPTLQEMRGILRG
jgi:hypothetical protein